jgi:hypothetical protein
MIPDHLRRRLLLALLAGGAGLSGALRWANAQEPNAQGMRLVTGDVRVNGQPAALGAPVRAGDTVATGKDGTAAFVVGRDAFLLRDNSTVELNGTNLLVDVLRLATGKLLAVFATGNQRRILTSSAVIGIRGTGGYLEAEPERSYFCLCYGTADVAPSGSAASETFVTRHHESPRYIYGDGRERPIVPADVSNHTDSELIMLEALVGRTPPAEVMNGPYMSQPYGAR